MEVLYPRCAGIDVHAESVRPYRSEREVDYRECRCCRDQWASGGQPVARGVNVET
jgi:hypothetical protein